MTLTEATTAQVARELARAALRLLAVGDTDYQERTKARQDVARLARQALKGVDLAEQPRRPSHAEL